MSSGEANGRRRGHVGGEDRGGWERWADHTSPPEQVDVDVRALSPGSKQLQCGQRSAFTHILTGLPLSPARETVAYSRRPPEEARQTHSLSIINDKRILPQRARRTEKATASFCYDNDYGEITENGSGKLLFAVLCDLAAGRLP